MLKLEAGPLDALLKRDGLVGDEVLVDVVELLVGLARVLERRLDKVGLRQVEVDVGGRIDEEGVESLSSPLQSGDNASFSELLVLIRKPSSYGPQWCARWRWGSS